MEKILLFCIALCSCASILWNDNCFCSLPWLWSPWLLLGQPLWLTLLFHCTESLVAFKHQYLWRIIQWMRNMKLVENTPQFLPRSELRSWSDLWGYEAFFYLGTLNWGTALEGFCISFFCGVVWIRPCSCYSGTLKLCCHSRELD